MSAPTPTSATRVMTIAVAGASGFIGRALCERLATEHRVLALSRGAGPARDGIERRRCDLFSLLDCERALAGADVAVYLVHSMMPSARLTQASFADMDLILADNFARAARRVGVGQIVYLGGIVPEAGPGRTAALSPHLASRVEVEQALAAHGVPVTTLRASLVIGPDGSSFRILHRLVERLPVMILPRWTRSPCQPIHVDDVVALLAAVCGATFAHGQTYDIGGPEVLSYADLLRRTARVLGQTPRFVTVPFFSPELSRLWVTLVTNTSRQLVGPLVSSLRHPMVARDLRLQERLGLPGMPLDESLRGATAASTRPGSRRGSRPGRRDAGPGPLVPVVSTVRSVQRLPLPAGRDAVWATAEYMTWLPRALRPWLWVRVDEVGLVRFGLVGSRAALLELAWSRERSLPDRTLLYVVGGLLARVSASETTSAPGGPGAPTGPKDGLAPRSGRPAPPATTRVAEGHRGRLELRVVLGGRCLLAAVHDLVPSLPWPLYNATQALAHLWVMRAFGRHLRRRAEAEARETRMVAQLGRLVDVEE